MNNNDMGRLISETGIVPKKSKGQNFLIDDRVAERHVGYAGISKTDKVLEVGPGLGVLTRKLVDASENVTCIELDKTLAQFIKETYGTKIRLIEGDAVKVEFPPFDIFVSNLPYSVSTPIIFKLLNYNFKKAVVMVQKEFADRMTADVGSSDYSRLTVNLFFKADCKILEKVPRSRFNPVPKVDSALVEIVPRPTPFIVKNEELFFKITEVTFSHRRKKIGTSLKAANIIPKNADLPYLDSRIETLKPAEIGELTNAVHDIRHGL